MVPQSQIATGGVTYLGKIRRGCGFRKAGAIYAVSDPPISDEALNLDFMLVCPPWQPWEKSPTEIGLAAQGMLILERRYPDGAGMGIWDIWDWIGQHDYPHFPDFFEELRNHGKSRLIPRTSPFKLLSQESAHLFVHAYGRLVDPLDAFYKDRQGLKKCPAGIAYHDDNSGLDTCTALLWEAVDWYQKPDSLRLHEVELPRNRPSNETSSCSYQGARVPFGVKAIFEPAVIMQDWITRFEIVEDPIDQKHRDGIKAIEENATENPHFH